MNSEQLLNHALESNRFQVSSSALPKLLRYLDLLQNWNRVFNLTAITDVKEMIYLHLLDSLIVAPFIQGKRCLDVGTGAGLPGIPLAITHPEQYWTLLDKNNKKIRFLTQAVAELGLTNVTPVHARSEEFHATDCFDSIISRALGTISMFVTTTEHLLAPNGRLIAMKGKYPQDEIKDIPPSYQASIQRLDIKGMNIERHIVCIVKKNEEV